MLNFFQRFYCTVRSIISNTFDLKKLHQRRKNINTDISFASVNESMDHGNAEVRFRLSEISFFSQRHQVATIEGHMMRRQ